MKQTSTLTKQTHGTKVNETHKKPTAYSIHWSGTRHNPEFIAHQPVMEKWIICLLAHLGVPYQGVCMTIVRKVSGHKFTGDCDGRGISIGNIDDNALMLDLCPKASATFRVAFRLQGAKDGAGQLMKIPLTELHERLFFFGIRGGKIPASYLEKASRTFRTESPSIETSPSKDERDAKRLDLAVEELLRSNYDEDTIFGVLLEIGCFENGPHEQSRFEETLRTAGVPAGIEKRVIQKLVHAKILTILPRRGMEPLLDFGSEGYLLFIQDKKDTSRSAQAA